MFHAYDNTFFEEDVNMLDDALHEFLEVVSPSYKTSKKTSSMQVEESVNVVVVFVAPLSPEKPIIYMIATDSSSRDNYFVYGISCHNDSLDLYSRFVKAIDSTSYNVVGHK